MEHYEELQSLVNENAHIDTYINQVVHIEFINSGLKNSFIGFRRGLHEKYNFSGIEKIIGNEKLNALVEQFKQHLIEELNVAKKIKKKKSPSSKSW